MRRTRGESGRFRRREAELRVFDLLALGDFAAGLWAAGFFAGLSFAVSEDCSALANLGCAVAVGCWGADASWEKDEASASEPLTTPLATRVRAHPNLRADRTTIFSRRCESRNLLETSAAGAAAIDPLLRHDWKSCLSRVLRSPSPD